MKKFFSGRMRIFCFFFILSIPQNFFANYRLCSHDTRSFSLGEVRALSEQSLNPARISFSEKIETGIHVFNRFNMKELNTAVLYFNHPNKRIDYGAGLSVFGYEDYKITVFQSSFSKKILPVISLGIQLIYQNEYSFLKENRQDHYSSHFGCWYIPNDQIILAILVENILSSSFQNPLNGYLGIKYLSHKNLSLLLEGSYINEKYFNLSIGLEYYLLEQFIMRSGFQINPKTPSLGIAYQLGKWTLEVGFSFHSLLGPNSSIGINLHL